MILNLRSGLLALSLPLFLSSCAARPQAGCPPIAPLLEPNIPSVSFYTTDYQNNESLVNYIKELESSLEMCLSDKARVRNILANPR